MAVWLFRSANWASQCLQTLEYILFWGQHDAVWQSMHGAMDLCRLLLQQLFHSEWLHYKLFGTAYVPFQKVSMCTIDDCKLQHKFLFSDCTSVEWIQNSWMHWWSIGNDTVECAELPWLSCPDAPMHCLRIYQGIVWKSFCAVKMWVSFERAVGIWIHGQRAGL